MRRRPLSESGRKLLPRPILLRAPRKELGKTVQTALQKILARHLGAHGERLRIQPRTTLQRPFRKVGVAHVHVRRLYQARFLRLHAEVFPPPAFRFFQIVAQLASSGQKAHGVRRKPVVEERGRGMHAARQKTHVVLLQRVFERIARALAQHLRPRPLLPERAHPLFPRLAAAERRHGQKGHFLKLAHGTLRDEIEHAHFVHRVTEKFQAQRLFIARRQHVQNIAAPRHVARVRHHGHALIAPFHELLHEKLGRNVLPAPHGHDATVQKIQRRQRGNQVVRREHHALRRSRPQGVQHRQPFRPALATERTLTERRQKHPRPLPERTFRLAAGRGVGRTCASHGKFGSKQRGQATHDGKRVPAAHGYDRMPSGPHRFHRQTGQRGRPGTAHRETGALFHSTEQRFFIHE